jgi:ElaB/YqjD/DUF883 family membrane-anchored ribosome-binding protein
VAAWWRLSDRVLVSSPGTVEAGLSLWRECLSGRWGDTYRVRFIFGGGHMRSVHREAGQEPGLIGKAAVSVQDAASTAQEKAGELKERGRHRFADQLDERSTRAGSQARAVAQAIGRSSEQLRQEGKDTPARLVAQAAERIEGLGSYLEGRGGSEMLGDVEDFARRRPWFVAGVGLAAGLAASRFLKASSERRYESSGRRYSRGRGSGHAGGDGFSDTGTDPASAPIARELASGE